MAHLPLRVLRQHFPDAFAEVARFNSFAILREPKDRFLSALRQRLREFRGVPDTAVTDVVLRKEAEAVLKHMAANRDTFELQYVHFQRQIEFVSVDDQLVVKNICTVADLRLLESFVRNQIDPAFNPLIHHNVSKNIRSRALRNATARARPLIIKITSAAVRKAIRNQMAAVGLFEDSRRSDAMAVAVKEFEPEIARFYRADQELFDRVSGKSSPNKSALEPLPLTDAVGAQP